MLVRNQTLCNRERAELKVCCEGQMPANTQGWYFHRSLNPPPNSQKLPLLPLQVEAP